MQEYVQQNAGWLDLAPSAADLMREGDAQRTAGDFARAEEAYRNAVRMDPRSTDAWAELGCLMMDCRRFSESVTCFRQLVPEDVEDDGDDSAQSAVKLLLEIASRRSDWARGQFSLGCAYEQLGDLEQARQHL